MFQKAFVKLEKEAAEAVLRDVNPLMEGSPFKPESTTILGFELPFYPGYKFLDIADYGYVPEQQRFVVHKADNATILNWTNEPIYALNKKAPLVLTADTVTEYVRFFFTYVRGRHGRFRVAENVDDIAWKEEPPPAARKAIGKILAPVQLTKKNRDGSYDLILQMMFRDSLFKTAAHVNRDGQILLSEEELLIEDMPVLDDVLGQ